ncbi:hypothetical protein QO004_000324 [Rhizobium mesoamericanum]|uniref:hypothetical protein n=1 Tax=Rhizobium mesoamericanum TaxID=1079800 RepID=UPI0027840EC7|nr:hypothetical protein [Rhizobium mesoamericanum]MDQ0558551.1 hypothetical protein [Rhizobium mesoamericanum]
MTPGFRVLRDGVTALALLSFLWLVAAKLIDHVETVYSGQSRAADGDARGMMGRRGW